MDMGPHRLPGRPEHVLGDDAAPGTLFDDERCRVRRLRSPDGRTVICKEARGNDAVARMRHETSILTRLEGVPGVSQLADTTRPGALLLRDDAAMPLLSAGGPRDLLRFASQLASIVASVHGRGVVHRDISTANVLLAGPDRMPLLVDFDLATTFVEETPGFTHHRDIVGTLPYLAPEQTGRSGFPVDHRADLYAIGAVLYEVATGAPPFGFGTDDELQLLHDILLRVPPPVPVGPPALAEIVGRLLEKEPSGRYQSAEGLAHDLAALCRSPQSPLRLGEWDFPPRLSAPTRLIGRDSDIAQLRQAFEQSLEGALRGFLVAGAPGVGKTALVNQLRPIVAARGGWYVTGKSDQFRPDAAAGALVQAIRGIGRMLLAEPEAEVAATRRAARGAPGSSGRPGRGGAAGVRRTAEDPTRAGTVRCGPHRGRGPAAPGSTRPAARGRVADRPAGGRAGRPAVGRPGHARPRGRGADRAGSEPGCCWWARSGSRRSTGRIRCRRCSNGGCASA